MTLSKIVLKVNHVHISHEVKRHINITFLTKKITEQQVFKTEISASIITTNSYTLIMMMV